VQARLLGGSKAVQLDGGTICAGGDVITALDGHAIPDMTSLQQAVGGLEPGAQASVDLARAGGTVHVKVTLGSQPSSAPSIQRAACGG